MGDCTPRTKHYWNVSSDGLNAAKTHIISAYSEDTWIVFVVVCCSSLWCTEPLTPQRRACLSSWVEFSFGLRHLFCEIPAAFPRLSGTFCVSPLFSFSFYCFNGEITKYKARTELFVVGEMFPRGVSIFKRQLSLESPFLVLLVSKTSLTSCISCPISPHWSKILSRNISFH